MKRRAMVHAGNDRMTLNFSRDAAPVLRFVQVEKRCRLLKIAAREPAAFRLNRWGRWRTRPLLRGREGWGVARIVDLSCSTGLLNSERRDPPPLSSPTRGEETRRAARHETFQERF